MIQMAFYSFLLGIVIGAVGLVICGITKRQIPHTKSLILKMESPGEFTFNIGLLLAAFGLLLIAIKIIGFILNLLIPIAIIVILIAGILALRKIKTAKTNKSSQN